MKVLINGKSTELPSHITTIKLLIDHYKLGEKMLVVEQNKEIVERTMYKQQVIKPNDKIEIVNFVGGG